VNETDEGSEEEKESHIFQRNKIMAALTGRRRAGKTR
jgi:hypothetical protein